MATRKRAPAARKPRTTRSRTTRDPVAMIEPVRAAGAAALAAFESSFLENGASGIGVDGSTTRMLKGESGMQKVVKLSGDGGTYRAVVKVIFREGTTTRTRKSKGTVGR